MIAIVWGFIIGLTKRNALVCFGTECLFLPFVSLPILHVGGAKTRHASVSCWNGVYHKHIRLILYAYAFSSAFLKMLYVFYAIFTFF